VVQGVTSPRTAVAALAAMLTLGACATTPKAGTEAQSTSRARRPGVRTVLVLMPSSPSASATLAGLEQVVGEELDVVARVVDGEPSADEVARHVREVRPSAVVLMNNPSVRGWRAFQKLASGEERALPAIGVMSSFLRETSTGIPQLGGVIYEVPLVTTLVNLRALLKQPVKRVGVVHRAAFRGYVGEQRELIAPEGFELVGMEVPGQDPDALVAAVTKLRTETKVDVLWVLNDNALLDRDVLQRGWLPALRGNKVPVVVNVGSLISRTISFGTFGVLPDHKRLGAQAGALVSGLAERGFAGVTPEFEYPVSVETVLDVDFARKNLDLEESALAKIDRLVE
jgi:hypothetical protein